MDYQNLARVGRFIFITTLVITVQIPCAASPTPKQPQSNSFGIADLLPGDVILFRGGPFSHFGKQGIYGHSAVVLTQQQGAGLTFFDFTPLMLDRLLSRNTDITSYITTLPEMRVRYQPEDRQFDVFRPNFHINPTALRAEALDLAHNTGYNFCSGHVCSTADIELLEAGSDGNWRIPSPPNDAVERRVIPYFPNDFAAGGVLAESFHKENTDPLTLPSAAYVTAGLEDWMRDSAVVKAQVQYELAEVKRNEEAEENLNGSPLFAEAQAYASALCDYEMLRDPGYFFPQSFSEGNLGMSATAINSPQQQADMESALKGARESIGAISFLMPRADLDNDLLRHSDKLTPCQHQVLNIVDSASGPVDTRWVMARLEYEMAGGDEGAAIRHRFSDGIEMFVHMFTATGDALLKASAFTAEALAHLFADTSNNEETTQSNRGRRTAPSHTNSNLNLKTGSAFNRLVGAADGSNPMP